MLICYIRSSSINTFAMCEMKYFMSYVLGWRDKQNKKATMGTVVHKCLETLANIKLAKEQNKRKIKDEVFNHSIKELEDLELICRKSFDYYNDNTDEIEMDDSDYRQCWRWFNKALEYQDGVMDPRNQNISAAEEFFDIEIPHDWAKYEYEINGEKIQGQLSIKGTIDVIIDEGSGLYRILDYKTGRRMNWVTGKVKSYECFQKDTQLLLYYYAMKNKYPDREFYVSIYYINHYIDDNKVRHDGGVFDIAFDENDYKKAENMLRQKFEYIRSVELPQQLYSDQARAAAPKWGSDAFKCIYLCKFSQEWEKSGKSVCQHVHDMVKLKGIDAVTAEYADVKKFEKYGDGGGRLDKEL
jgi:hypothetical protein